MKQSSLGERRIDRAARGGRWRMEKPCENCPFNSSGPGLHLRKSLSKVRWRDVLAGLLEGQHFTCHKTSEECGDGSDLMCAGAIAWQNKRGASSNLQRIMERLDAIFQKGKP